jgi:Flp pilus assembly protein TadD
MSWNSCKSEVSRLPALVILLLAGCGGCVSRTVASRTALAPVSAMQRQVVNALDAGDGDYGARLLRARLEADPRDLKTRLELARYYQRAGFPEIAIEHCRLACERAPESPEAHLALAKMLRSDGKTAEAASELGEFAGNHKDDVEVWAWLGLLRDESGDWVSGERAHRKAVALAPGRDDLRNNLGYCLLKQSRRDEAAEEFRAALKINSQSTTARNNLGLAVAGNPTEAVLNWQSVSDPASAHNNMAVAFIEAGKYAEARQEIAIALSYNRQHSAALNNLRLVSELDGKAPNIAVPVRAQKKQAAR